MVITSSTSSSSCASLSSLDDVSVKSVNNGTNGNTVKFLCSYGGWILPRYPDGKLRYVGGETRVLAVDRSVHFRELQSKLGEICGYGGGVCFRCQLPKEDLDALVSITSAEDLANLIEEYDLAGRDKSSPLKIRAFLCPLPPPPSSSKIPKSASPPRQQQQRTLLFSTACGPTSRPVQAPDRRTREVFRQVGIQQSENQRWRSSRLRAV